MIETNLKVKYRKLDALKVFDGNARTHSDRQVDQLASIITDVGYTNPILIDETGTIIAGHGRLLAARKLGMATIPTIELRGLSEQDKLKLNVSDNQLALNAGWSAEALKLQLDQLKSWDVDLGLLGFSSSELHKIVGSDAVQQAQAAVYSEDQLVDAAFEHFREHGFPYPALALHQCFEEINALRATATDDLQNSSVAHRVADTFHRHKFDGRVDGKKSPIEGFNDDKLLRRVLAFAYKHGRTVPIDTPGILELMSGVQTCANFRPGFAAYLYRRFCPVGGTVLDTSTGYGGRLIGAIGSGVVGHYVGIDPSTKTHAGNQAMIDALTPMPITFRLINKPAEDVQIDDLSSDFDFAFTSPPYFSKEHYAEEPTQSWKRYPTGEAWRDSFLRAMLKLQFNALRSGALSLVNIEDVKIRDVLYPLVEWTREIGSSIGFEFERMEQFPLPASNWVQEEGVERFEHVLVFRKP